MRPFLLLSVPLLALASHASAQTTLSVDDTFTVSIDITKACGIVSTTNINFGQLAAGAPNPSATGTIQVACSVGTTYTLGLNNGVNYASGTRNMLGPSSGLIPYTLSAASAGGANWGNASPDWEEGTGTGMTTPVSHTVHAQATLTGGELPGTYEDTVTATLSF